MIKLGTKLASVYFLYTLSSFVYGDTPQIRNCYTASAAAAERLTEAREFVVRIGDKTTLGEVLHAGAAVVASLKHPSDSLPLFIYLDGYSNSEDFSLRLSQARENYKSKLSELTERNTQWDERVNQYLREVGLPISDREKVEQIYQTGKNNGLSFKGTQFNDLLKVKRTVERAEAEMKLAESSLISIENTDRYVNFLKALGVGERIVEHAIDHWPGFHHDGNYPPILSLKGQPMARSQVDSGTPTHSFANPMRISLPQLTTKLSTALSTHPELKSTISEALAPGAVPKNVEEYAHRKIVSQMGAGKKARVLWNRQEAYEPERNLDEITLLKMISEAEVQGNKPVLMGKTIPPEWRAVHSLILSGRVIDCTNHWKDPESPFRENKDSVQNQLYLFKYLLNQQKIDSQVGMLAGVMDGPALLGVPTVVYMTESKAEKESEFPRMRPFANSLGSYSILPHPR